MNIEHSMSCEWPEGCSCGAEQVNYFKRRLAEAERRADDNHRQMMCVAAYAQPDKLRLDWLKHGIKIMCEEGAVGYPDQWSVYDKDWSRPLGVGETLRAAIDDAMAKEVLKENL